jgi:hypothetical protein
MSQVVGTRRAASVGRMALAILACVWIVGARPAIASCDGPTGPCSATVDLSDARFDNHFVPFSAVSGSDMTADTSIDIQRHWTFIASNHGPGTVGSASLYADSLRTFSTTPPPPYTAGPMTLAPDTNLRTSSTLEAAYALDTAAPGFTSSRSVSPLAIPPGGTVQTMTAKFTVNSASAAYGFMELLIDADVPGATWTFTSSSDLADTQLVNPGPGSQVQVNINHPVVGTAYTVTFTGVIPNASTQAFAYKPRLLFQAGHSSVPGQVFADRYATFDPILEGTPTFTFDEPYELHPRSDNAFGVDYLGGTATIVGSFPSSGAFVIGDQSAAPGSQVTFWGAQWPKQNSLSNGPAPSAFKGFESGGQPSACGGTWTADPGNSGNPPASVPDLMTVIVSSHVSQTGSQLSGDVAHIVVVKTDPGYAPDPGHAGTGQVLATLC